MNVPSDIGVGSDLRGEGGHGAPRPLKVGLVGAGMNGSAFVRYYAENSQTELVAVADVDVNRARWAEALVGTVRTYHDYEVMLQHEDLDVVSVHTPDHLHTGPVVAALESGRHVFCEKPLGNSIEDCRTMLDAFAKAGDRVVACGHVLRLHPVYRAVKRMIDGDVLGDVVYVEGDYIHDLRRQDRWQLEHELPMVGGGCHPLDIMQWWCGPIVEVEAISSHRSVRQMRADDCIVSLLRFTSGTVGRCTTAYGLAGPMAPLYNLSAYGTKVSVIRDTVGIGGLDNEFTKLPVSYSRELQYGRHDFAGEVDDLVEAIRRARAPSASIYDGASAVAVALAVNEAVRVREPVAVQQPGPLVRKYAAESDMTTV